MYDKRTFADQLTAILKEKGVTQRDIAEHFEVSEAAVSRYVKGIRVPSLDVIVELSEFLNVSLDRLIGVETQRERKDPEITILVSCFKKASFEQRTAIWSILNSYGLMQPEQKVIIDAIQTEEKSEAV